MLSCHKWGNKNYLFELHSTEVWLSLQMSSNFKIEVNSLNSLNMTLALFYSFVKNNEDYNFFASSYYQKNRILHSITYIGKAIETQVISLYQQETRSFFEND